MIEIKSKNGWISPKGKFFPCGHMCHEEQSYKILDDHYNGSSYEALVEYDGGGIALHKLGWVKLSTWKGEETKVFGNCFSNDHRLDTLEPSLTQEQKNFLKECCLWNEFEYKNLF